MKYKMKQRIEGGYKTTEYEVKAGALPKLMQHARRIKAELFDESGAQVETGDVALKQQLLLTAINSEWETIRNYEAWLENFSAEERTVMQDIITEEKVHIGQLEVLLDNIGISTTEHIAEGVQEGEAQLDGNIGAEVSELSASERLAAYKAKRAAVVKTALASRKKRAEQKNATTTMQQKVKCSIGELIEQEVLNADVAREAYALGYKDALQRAEAIEAPDLDTELEIEYFDTDSAEQAVYDAGVEKAKSDYADEGEFDDDIDPADFDTGEDNDEDGDE